MTDKLRDAVDMAIEQAKARARAEALEEAAKVVEEWAKASFPAPEPEVASIAAAIRALK